MIFALGLGLVLAGAHLLLHSSQLRRRGHHTWGRVSGVSTNPARSQVTFHTLEGAVVTVSSRLPLVEGAVVPLYYAPDHPEEFVINNQLYQRGPYALIGLGLVIIPLAWLP